jgi:VWFA-related protein
MRTRCGSWICLFSVSLLSGFAQQNRPADHSITLDVAVTDKAGKPVAGLEQQDFTLLDNKQPQKILSFQAVGGAAPAGPPVEVVLMVDEVNTPFSRVAIVREQIEKFLGQNGGALALPVSVAVLDDSGKIVRTPVTRDGKALIADLEQADFGLRSIRKSVQGIFGAEDQQRISLQGLGQLTDYETATPGRKLVVWLSPGWPLFFGLSTQLSSKDQQGIFSSVVAFSDEMRRARITLSNVDPGGATEGEMHMSDFEQFFKGVKKPGQVALGDLGLQPLAHRTGGRILEASNDLAGEIAICVQDGTAYYVLGFEGLPGDGPNEYHELEVKVDKPKLTVRTQSGYYAQPFRQAQ